MKYEHGFVRVIVWLSVILNHWNFTGVSRLIFPLWLRNDGWKRCFRNGQMRLQDIKETYNEESKDCLEKELHVIKSRHCLVRKMPNVRKS